MRVCPALAAAFVLAAAPLAGQGAPGDLPDGLTVSSREERYLIDVRTFGEVVDTLNRMRLRGGAHGPSQALTDYRVEPQWRFEVVEGGCAVTSLRVDVTIRITLPRWTGAAAAPKPEREAWAELLGRITGHEYTHREITIDVAKELLDRLGSLEAGNCGTLRRATDGALAIARKELRDRHAAFDELDGSGGR